MEHSERKAGKYVVEYLGSADATDKQLSWPEYNVALEKGRPVEMNLNHRMLLNLGPFVESGIVKISEPTPAKPDKARAA